MRQRENSPGREELELLVEVGLHLLDPLRDEPLGGDDQDSLDQPPELEFPEDQPRLDGLAQADLIGQQVADAVVGHRPRQGVKLVRQRDHPGFERCQQHVLGQGVGDAGGGGGVDEPVEAWPSWVAPAVPGRRRPAARPCSCGEPRPGRRCGSRRSPRRGCGRTPRDSG